MRTDERLGMAWRLRNKLTLGVAFLFELKDTNPMPLAWRTQEATSSREL